MNEQANTSQNTEQARKGFKHSTSLKMLVVGALILVLLIPLLYIQSLIKERARTKETAVQEIFDNWGENIRLYGPILKIPYIVNVESIEKDTKTKKVITVTTKETRYAYFFPEILDINGTINGEPKKRGIYETVVYHVDSELKGSFTSPDIKQLELDSKQMQWDKAQIILKSSNVKGVTEHLTILLNGKPYGLTTKFETNDYVDHYEQQSFELLSQTFDFKSLLTEGQLDFSLSFKANGSEQFEVIPVGKQTNMQLKSPWKDTKFFGEYLPQNPDKVTKDGFNAQWTVLDMNRPFSQSYYVLPNLNDFYFGVELINTVDGYQQNERSAKYGYLVISLTFLLFFLIQLLSKISIHPFQYLMIGLALVIFYTLLISITEHSDFTTAYLMSAGATVGLISLYTKSILKTWQFTLFIFVSLLALYGFIYIIIQLESYALLVGSIGLFAILAAVMYTSRKIDWQNL